MPEEMVEDLKVSVKDGKVCEKILKINVGSADIQKEYDEFFKAVAPQAKVPGFRPGKAPRNVLAMHYQSEARENVLKHLISASYRQAVKTQALEPLGYPDIEDVQFADDKLSYQARIEIRPKVKLNKVEGLSVVREEALVTEKEIEESLMRLRKSLAQHKPVEDRAAILGDFIVAEYTCTVEGEVIDKRNDDWFELKEDEFLKGFSTQLVGVKAGEEKSVTITLPEKFGRKELVGKPAVFQIKVKEIKKEELPSVDDELAKSAGEFKTLEELKERIRKDILEAKQHENEAAYERALLDEFLKHNKVDLPEGLVSRRSEFLLEDTIENYKRRGVPGDKLEELKADLKKETDKEAKRQVHLAFLLDEVAAKNNLTVSDEDIKARYTMLAERTRQKAEDIQKYYEGNHDALHSLQDQIQNEKAIEFIKRAAKPKTK